MAGAIEDLAERIKADSIIYIDTGKSRARRGADLSHCDTSAKNPRYNCFAGQLLTFLAS